MHRPNILGVITARAGSKGIPGKNVKPLGDLPLIAYTIRSAKKSGYLTHLIVSTDGADIARVSREWGAEVPFMRPPELSGDRVPHLPVMQHAIAYMEEKLGSVFDYAVILQPTSPFRTPEDIDGTLSRLIETGADSAVSLVEVENSMHPVKMKKLSGDFVVPYCVPEPEGIRRQDLETAYRRNGSVYAMRRDLLMKENRLYGEKIAGYIVPAERSIDIDYPLDWVIAEYMLRDLKNKGHDFSS